MNGKIKVGQIGVAHAHAAGKMDALRASPDYEVVGIVESDESLRREAERSDTYRDLKWMTREQLFNVPGLKAVAVETEVGDLLNVAEECVNAGLHIHLDKPAGESLPQFRRILEMAASKHLLVQMGYMYRYNPAVMMLREFLRQEWLGEPFEVHCVMSKVIGRDGRAGLAKYRGGLMFELGCHIIDLVVGVLGKPERVTSYAQHVAEIDDGLSDNMLAVLEYPRSLATVKSSAMEVEGFSRRHFVVCGTQGTFHIQPLDNPAATIALAEPRGAYRAGYQEVSFGRFARYIDDMADMAKIIRREKDADFSYGHDLAVQGTVLRSSGISVD